MICHLFLIVHVTMTIQQIKNDSLHCIDMNKSNSFFFVITWIFGLLLEGAGLCGRKPEYPQRTHTGTGGERANTPALETQQPKLIIQSNHKCFCFLFPHSRTTNQRNIVPGKESYP